MALEIPLSGLKLALEKTEAHGSFQGGLGGKWILSPNVNFLQFSVALDYTPVFNGTNSIGSNLKTDANTALGFLFGYTHRF